MIGAVQGVRQDGREGVRDGLRARVIPWMMRDDTPGDLVRIVIVVVAYAVTDVLTRATASVPFGTDRSAVLAWRSIGANPISVVALLVALGLMWRFARGDIAAGWSPIDHGRTLRWLALPLVLFTVWELAFYEFNYLLEEWHAIDRLLLVVLAVGAWFRPAVLILFVLQARIIAGQFSEPFGTTAGENIGELLLVALLVIAAIHLVVTITAEPESASTVLVLGAAIATHFFLPGWGKARIGWAGANEPGNFALNSYTAGWMGGGDGGWARFLADAADNFAWVIVTVTVVAELCAFVAAYHRKLLRCWLPLWAVFQLGIFAMSGFFLLGWIVLELAFAGLLLWPGGTEWLSQNDTPARGILAVGLVVVLGPLLFHPPRLAWIDSPIGYGYEVEAVGVAGTKYHVPLTAFAPFQQELSLGFAHFRDARDVVGAYGAAGSVSRAELLAQTDSFDELAAMEARLGPSSIELRQRSEAFVMQWFDTVNERGDPNWFLLAPPTRYWAGRPSPTFTFQEPLESVTVVRVIAIHHTEESLVKRIPLLTVGSDASDRTEVVNRFDG